MVNLFVQFSMESTSKEKLAGWTINLIPFPVAYPCSMDGNYRQYSVRLPTEGWTPAYLAG